VIIEHAFPKSQTVDVSVVSDDNSQLWCERDTTIPEKYKQNFDVSSEGLSSGRSFINEMSLKTSKFRLCSRVVESLSRTPHHLPYETNHLNKNTIFFQTYNKGDKRVSPESLFFAQRYNIILNIIFEFRSLAL
jgi:hypothetical protein